jgi:hypothetical protein
MLPRNSRTISLPLWDDSKSEMCSLLAQSHLGTLERHLFAFVEDGLVVCLSGAGLSRPQPSRLKLE